MRFDCPQKEYQELPVTIQRSSTEHNQTKCLDHKFLAPAAPMHQGHFKHAPITFFLLGVMSYMDGRAPVALRRLLGNLS